MSLPGIDVGGSGCKVAAFDIEGRRGRRVDQRVMQTPVIKEGHLPVDSGGDA
jgi:sugar (pentulose or hexulose) kinase